MLYGIYVLLESSKFKVSEVASFEIENPDSVGINLGIIITKGRETYSIHPMLSYSVSDILKVATIRLRLQHRNFDVSCGDPCSRSRPWVWGDFERSQNFIKSGVGQLVNLIQDRRRRHVKVRFIEKFVDRG